MNWQALFLGVAVSVVAVTLTKSPLFAWWRNVMKRVSVLLGKLFHCPYCTAHWVAMAAVWVSGLRLDVQGPAWFVLLVSWLVVVGVAAVTTQLMGANE